MQEIKLLPGLLDLVESGQKTSTCRLGLKTKYTLGPVRFRNSKVPEDVLDIGAEIIRIEAIDFSEIDDELAQKENYKNAGQLKAALEKIYGKIDEYDTITVIEWYR